MAGPPPAAHRQIPDGPHRRAVGRGLPHIPLDLGGCQPAGQVLPQQGAVNTQLGLALCRVDGHPVDLLSQHQVKPLLHRRPSAPLHQSAVLQQKTLRRTVKSRGPADALRCLGGHIGRDVRKHSCHSITSWGWPRRCRPAVPESPRSCPSDRRPPCRQSSTSPGTGGRCPCPCKSPGPPPHS